MMLALMGCATEPDPRPIRQTQADRARSEWKQMKKRDAQLRSQFEKIQVGMSPQEVRTTMGTEPQIKRDRLWGFKLSRASDTDAEINWTLLVAFENGKVKSKQTTNTCIYRTERK